MSREVKNLTDSPNTFVSGYNSSNKHKLLNDLLKENRKLLSWRPREKILDVGCGTGDFMTRVILPWLQNDFQLLVGADMSPNMLEYARAHHNGDKVEYVLADICENISHIFQIESNCDGFDKIISFFTFQWVGDINKAVENLNKLLKPGGEVFLSFPTEYEFDKTFEKVQAEEEWKVYFKGGKKQIPKYITDGKACKKFEAIMKSGGFEIIKCEVECFHFVFDDTSAFLKLVNWLDLDSQCLPPHLAESYLQDCFEEMKRYGNVFVKEDRVYFNQLNMIVVARKPSI